MPLYVKGFFHLLSYIHYYRDKFASTVYYGSFRILRYEGVFPMSVRAMVRLSYIW